MVAQCSFNVPCFPKKLTKVLFQSFSNRCVLYWKLSASSLFLFDLEDTEMMFLTSSRQRLATAYSTRAVWYLLSSPYWSHFWSRKNPTSLRLKTRVMAIWATLCPCFGRFCKSIKNPETSIKMIRYFQSGGLSQELVNLLFLHMFFPLRFSSSADCLVQKCCQSLFRNLGSLRSSSCLTPKVLTW